MDHRTVRVSKPKVQSDVVPRVAAFFALYADALGLTDRGSIFVAMEAKPVRGYPTKIALHVKGDAPPICLPSPMSQSLIVSVRFHRGQRDKSLVQEHHDLILPRVKAIVGDQFPEFERIKPTNEDDRGDVPSKPDDLSYSTYTVVEMTTQLVVPGKTFWEPCYPTEAVMGPTLTRCIDGLIRVINAYRFAEKISIPSPSRERVGPIVIAATRAADPNQGSWDAPAHYVVNSFATARQPQLRGKESTTTIKEMMAYLQLEAFDHPSIPLMHLQADLNTAFYHDGNYRSTAMFAYSASEVLLDIALMGMLFEEEQSPAVAVSIFDKPLKSRILTDYHERLGGSWTPKGAHAVATWLRDVLLVRHRVVHAGYLPSHDEASAALNAYFSLGTHLRNRLAVRAKKYPFTAGTLVTQGGFDRRGIRTKAAEAAVNATGEKTLKAFLSWRTELIALRA